MTESTVVQRVERNRRALAILYNISIACRGQVAFQPIFAAIAAELRALFAYDACYIAVCDIARPGFLRAALLIDEDLTIYEEDTAYGSLTSTLIATREPLLFTDLAMDRGALEGPALMFGDTQKVSRAWMGVPLLLGEDTVGVISLQSYRPGLYAASDIDLLQQAGNLAAVILENATLGQSQRELSAALSARVAARTRELNALGDLAAEMVRGQQIGDLLERALDQIVDLFAVDAAIIRLIEPSGDMLRLAAQRGMPEAYMRKHLRIPMADTVLGKVIAENRVLATGSEYAAGLRERGLPFQAGLSVPMRIGTQILGGMSLMCRTPRTFGNEEADVALVLANQVAIAIENARLFADRDRKVAELTALGVIAQAASNALDLSTLLRQVHSALSELLPLDAFSMVVYDPERKIITDGISIDEGEEYGYWHRQPPPPDSLTAWVITNRRPLHFDDLAHEVEAYPELARRYIIGSGRHAVSWLGVPLLNRDGAPIGVINVQSYRPAMFSARDERFLLNVAGQVALHVQNVGLLAHQERQIRELDAIGRISQHVSSSLSLEPMLQPVYAVLQETTGASSFFLIICEPEQHRILHDYYIDGGQEIRHDWPDGRPPSQSLTSWILNNSRPLLFDDLHAESDSLRVVGTSPVVYGSEDHPRSWSGVPLLDSEARPIGVIAIQDSRAYQYDRQTIAFLSQIALHISLGVQKAELFAAERAARRTADTLREVARVLSSTFDPNEVLDIVLRELQHVVPYDTASIMLLEGDGLRVVAICGWEQNMRRIEMFPLNQESAAVRVVRARTPIVISDTRTAPEWHTTYPLQDEIRSWLGVPLVAKGRVLGVLNIDSRRPDRFLPRDVEVALTFASQAAVSLENARLYAESITRVEQELVIARQIQSNLFPHDLPKVAGLQLAARCLPARETGGDFYDCFILNPTVSAVGGWASDVINQQGILALMVGDASGKSIPGAMLMAVARSVARSEARDHIEPAAVMCETNQLVALDVPHGSFVALTYATIDLRTQRLALSSAGQIAPIRRRRDGHLEELLPSGPALPLGIRHETAYLALEVDLMPGDTLVFFTDGLVEAHDPARHMFGFEQVEHLIREYGDRAPDELIEILLDAVYGFIGPTPQHDDITVLVVKVL